MTSALGLRLAALAASITLGAQALPAQEADSLAQGMLRPGRVEYADGSEGVLLPDRLPFGPGEVLDFELQYGVVDVGRARLEAESIELEDGRVALSILSRAKSARWIDSVYKVRDEIRSVLDLDRLHSLRFEKHLREGKYRADLEAEFDHARGMARYEDGSESELPPGSQDILTALYYVRSFSLEEGMVLHIPVHDGKKSYALRVSVVGRERLKTELGELDCLILEPTLRSRGLFKSEGRMQIYLSDDDRRLPVLLKAKAPVGAFTSVLKAYRAGEPLPLPSGQR